MHILVYLHWNFPLLRTYIHTHKGHKYVNLSFMKTRAHLKTHTDNISRHPCEQLTYMHTLLSMQYMLTYTYTHIHPNVIYARIHMHTLECRRHNIPRIAADEFFKELQREAFANAHELIGEVPGAAQRLWTSAKNMT